MNAEQKAKAYEEAIERAKAYQGLRSEMEIIFPELKESENERIRKNIKIALMSMEDNLADFYSTHRTSQKELLTWLEKQGETFIKKDVDDAYLKGVCDTKQEFEKQGEQKFAWSEEVERLCNAGLHNSTISKKDVLNTILAVVNDFKEEPVSIWHDSGEMPKEKKVCLIRYSANDGASTNNFEVVIAESLTRRFVTRSYPHKTGYQHTIHGENTIKVDEYQDRREYIPFSDIDEWAYIDDLLNLSNVQRIVKNWEEPVSEDLEQEIEECNSNLVPTRSRTILKKKFENCAKHFANWQKQQMKANAVEVEVKVDAGGYPYIPAIELYDYDKDVPLAKAGISTRLY